MSKTETGTRDTEYDLVSVLYHSLQGAEVCETYCRDAQGDAELERFFKDAQARQRETADQAKNLLKKRLD